MTTVKYSGTTHPFVLGTIVILVQHFISHFMEKDKSVRFYFQDGPQVLPLQELKGQRLEMSPQSQEKKNHNENKMEHSA